MGLGLEGFMVKCSGFSGFGVRASVKRILIRVLQVSTCTCRFAFPLTASQSPNSQAMYFSQLGGLRSRKTVEARETSPVQSPETHPNPKLNPKP